MKYILYTLIYSLFCIFISLLIKEIDILKIRSIPSWIIKVCKFTYNVSAVLFITGMTIILISILLGVKI